ncbi:hypothetical protein PENTCL1PPCAC_15827, partial [Pristionchus entomophagus]
LPMIDLRIACSLLAVISLIGLVANTIAIYAVFRYKHLHNTFGALCVVLAATNFGILFVFVVWSSIGTYLFAAETFTGTIGKVVGQITLFLLFAKDYAHLGISINRLFSLMSPFKASAAIDLSSASVRQKRKTQIGFFIQSNLFTQSLCQMVPLILMYISFDILSRFASDDWELYGTTTFVWALLHAVDG